MSESNRVKNLKVVAIPVAPFDPTTYQQKQSSDDTSTASSYHSRLRSRRVGGSISRSRDIVQDVYDRMGVNYVRGRPAIETLLQDTRIMDAQKSDGQNFRDNTTSGSLSVEVNSGHQVSGGHINAQWPPQSLGSPQQEDEVPSHRTFLRSNENEDKPSFVSRTLPHSNENEDQSRLWSIPDASSRSFPRKHSDDKRDEEGKNMDVPAPDDERDAVSTNSGGRSIRDRISLYGTSVRAGIGGSSRANVRHSYGGTTSKRSHPPKVNIYESSSVGNGGVKEETCFSVDASRGGDQSRWCGVASGAISTSRCSVGDAFLSAINNSNNQRSPTRHISRNIAVVEIPNNDVQDNENTSVASSVSGEDFMTSPRQRVGKLVKMPFGVEVGKVANIPYATPMDKQINDCVQAQISILTRKFDADIRRVENCIDEECKARITALEKRNEELTVLLAKAGIRV